MEQQSLRQVAQNPRNNQLFGYLLGLLGYLARPYVHYLGVLSDAHTAKGSLPRAVVNQKVTIDIEHVPIGAVAPFKGPFIRWKQA